MVATAGRWSAPSDNRWGSYMHAMPAHEGTVLPSSPHTNERGVHRGSEDGLPLGGEPAAAAAACTAAAAATQ